MHPPRVGVLKGLTRRKVTTACHNVGFETLLCIVKTRYHNNGLRFNMITLKEHVALDRTSWSMKSV